MTSYARPRLRPKAGITGPQDPASSGHVQTTEKHQNLKIASSNMYKTKHYIIQVRLEWKST